jgi:hypothetical protein
MGGHESQVLGGEGGAEEPGDLWARSRKSLSGR